MLRITTAVAAVATSMAMIIPTTAAVADPGALVVTGTISWPQFPGSGTASFSGSATGTSSGSAWASFTYTDSSCAFGSAHGIMGAGGHNFSFSWGRLGAVAVVTVSGAHTGAAVVGFAVTSPAPALALAAACVPGAPPVPVTASLAGAAVFV